MTRRRRPPASQESRAILDAEVAENPLLAAIITYARLLGFLANHNYDSRRSGPDDGLPDLLLAGNGRTLWIETKTMRGRLRLGQERWRAALLAAHAEYYFWRPSDWSNGTIERILSAHLKAA